jgi:hypothetical protein
LRRSLTMGQTVRRLAICSLATKSTMENRRTRVVEVDARG